MQQELTKSEKLQMLYEYERKAAAVYIAAIKAVGDKLKAHGIEYVEYVRFVDEHEAKLNNNKI